MHYETLHTETRDGFDIVFSVAPETETPDGHFDDDGETAAAIRDGEFEWFIARVEAKKQGITLGTAYLGGCCYRSAGEFVTAGDYYDDMVKEAISEARDTLKELAA
jgi:hypothetical protein